MQKRRTNPRLPSVTRPEAIVSGEALGGVSFVHSGVRGYDSHRRASFMKPIRFCLAIVITCLMGSLASAQPAAAPATAPARGRGRGPAGPPPSATMPVNSGLGQRMHPQFLEVAKQGNIDLLFIGDSITDFWDDANPNRGGKPVWDRTFVPLKAANFGVNADRTQHV